LFVEHDVKNALDVAHRVYIIDRGQIIYEGLPETVREGNLLRDVLLGKAETGNTASFAPEPTMIGVPTTTDPLPSDRPQSNSRRHRGGSVAGRVS
jgi:ABC-type cobalamin/Fe3+-siderophores transport system ATPase subunit